MSIAPDQPPPESRRSSMRVRANLKVVLARSDGEKQPATVVDVSTRGMLLRAERTPSYGEGVTVVVQLGLSEEWHLIPATVRWFDRQAFGVAFENLHRAHMLALDAFVAGVAR